MDSIVLATWEEPNIKHSVVLQTPVSKVKSQETASTHSIGATH